MKQHSNRIRAVRGATTADEDTPTCLNAAIKPLLEALVEKNRIAEPDVVSVFLTVTPDIHSASPARMTRQILGWQHTAIMSSQEPLIENFPERCIRIMIQFYESEPNQTIHPVYQNGAQSLRPDLPG